MKHARFSPFEIRLLSCLPEEGSVTFGELEASAGLRRAELVITLAQLVIGRHILAWQEGDGSQVTRWYRRCSPAEQVAPTHIEYDPTQPQRASLRQPTAATADAFEHP